MTRAPGTRRRWRRDQRTDEVPLWPAAEIQPGPRTVAMLTQHIPKAPWSCATGIWIACAGRGDDHGDILEPRRKTQPVFKNHKGKGYGSCRARIQGN